MRENPPAESRLGFCHFIREGILRPAPYPTLLVLSLLLYLAAIIGGAGYNASEHGQPPSLSLNVLGQAESSYRAGELTQAHLEYTQAAAISPKDTTYLMGLGVTDNALGEQTRAIDTFKQVLRIKPDHADASYFLGLLYLQRNEIETAIAYLSLSIRVRPENTTASLLNDLGVAYRRNGEPAKARQSFARALSIEPELQSAQQNLAKLGPPAL